MTRSKLDRIVGNPTDAPPSLSGVLSAITAALHQIASTSSSDVGGSPVEDDRLRQFAKLSAADAPSTISILGERGSGKSTALHYACARMLMSREHLVLPIIQPERFAQGDTLSGWILAQLSQFAQSIEVDWLSFDEEPLRWDDTRDLLDRMIRQQAIVGGAGYGSTLNGHNMAPDEYARDISLVAYMGAEFLANWRTLVSSMLGHYKSMNKLRESPLLIIPIDDADLRVDLLPRLLADVRAISAHPSVVTILCAEWDSLRNSLIGHKLSDANYLTMINLDIANKQDLVAQVDQQLTKTLPKQHRCIITPLSNADKLYFRPLGHEKSMADLLSELNISSEIAKVSSLLAYFDMSEAVGLTSPLPSPYVAGLPSTARELEQMYFRVQAVIESQGGRRRTAMGAGQVVAHSLDAILPLVTSDLRGVIELERDGDSVGVRFNFENFETGNRLGGGITVRSKANAPHFIRMRVRRIDSVGRATYRHDETSVEVPDPLVSAILLAQELAYPQSDRNEVFHNLGYFGDLTTPGTSAWPAVEITVGGGILGITLWTVPDWDTFFDYFIYQHIWNRLVSRALLEDYDEPGLQNDRMPTHLLLTHVELICLIQKDRKVPPDFIAAAENLAFIMNLNETAWNSYTDASVDRIANLVRQLYKSNTGKSAEGRDIEFDSWFATWLPRLFIDGLFYPRVLTGLRGLREEMLGSTLTSFNTRCAAMIAEMIRSDYSQTGVRMLVEMVAHLDESIGQQLGGEVALASNDRARQADRVLDLLRQRGVTEDLITELAIYGLTSAMEARLAAIGLPSAAILALRDALPAVLDRARE